MALPSLSPEERAVMQEKARLSRLAKKEAALLLKTEYADMSHWRDLASRNKLRLPASHLPNTEVKYLKRAAKALGVDIKEYLSDCGCTSLKELVEFNPTWTAAGELGMFLEWYDEKEKGN